MAQTFNRWDVTQEADVYFAYRLLLNREPEAGAVDGWIQEMASRGLPVRRFAEITMGSVEWLSKRDTDTIPVETRGHTLFIDRFTDTFSGNPKWMVDDEPHVLERLEMILNPGSVFVDVGANVGQHAIFGAKIVGETGRVIAIEPSQRRCRMLILAIDANKLSNVTLIPACAWDSIGIVGMNGLGCIGFISELQGSELLCPAIPIDLLGLDRVDCIKIDVEGVEWKVLAGMEATIRFKRPVVVLELHWESLSRGGCKPADILNWFQAQNYTCEILPKKECLKGQYDNPIDALPLMEANVKYNPFHLVFLPKK